MIDFIMFPEKIMLRIMLSYPDFFAREGIKHMLEKDADLCVVFEAREISETIEALHAIQPQVCIVGLSMARNYGLRFVREASRIASTTSFLVMGHFHEREIALRALRSGAAGYLRTDCTAEQLSQAIRAVAARRPYINERVSELLAESIVDGRPTRPHDRLSDVDFEVLCLMAEGVPVHKIASICRLAAPAVHARRNGIMKAMAFGSDAEIVEYAMDRKLIDLSYRLA